jgi:hypothetical protein
VNDPKHIDYRSASHGHDFYRSKLLLMMPNPAPGSIPAERTMLELKEPIRLGTIYTKLPSHLTELVPHPSPRVIRSPNPAQSDRGERRLGFDPKAAARLFRWPQGYSGGATLPQDRATHITAPSPLLNRKQFVHAIPHLSNPLTPLSITKSHLALACRCSR